MSKSLLIVRVKTNKHWQRVIPLHDTDEDLEVWLKSLPIEGKANKELIELLSNYFGKKVEIVKGFRSKRKLIKIYE